MFTNEQKNAWQKVKAPETLLFETEKRITETKRSTFKYTSLVSLAAALFLVAGIYFFGVGSFESNVKVFYQDALLGEEEQDFYVYDRKSLIYSRSLPTRRVDFIIECDGKTEFSVDSGVLSVFSADGSLICDGDEVLGEGEIQLVWSNFDFDESDTLTLDVKNKKQEYAVILSCTELTDICTVKCIRK